MPPWPHGECNEKKSVPQVFGLTVAINVALTHRPTARPPLHMDPYARMMRNPRLFLHALEWENWPADLFAGKYVAFPPKMACSILAVFGLELNMPFCCDLLGFSYAKCIRVLVSTSSA